MTDPRFFQKKSPLSLLTIAKEIEIMVDDQHHSLEIQDVASLSEATKQDVTFFENKKYIEQLKETSAAACILRAEEVMHLPKNCIPLISENPYYSYALLVNLLYKEEAIKGGIHPTAVIGEGCEIDPNSRIEAYAVVGDRVTIGSGTSIGASSVIGDGVMIGNHCHIASHCSMTHAIIGDHVTIHQGVRIGQDGFGFATNHGKHVRIPQLGRVIIKDYVNIGAGSTIDRGSASDTVIGENTQIDNLVQIAHNVKIGRGCVIVSQVGIAGSTVLEDYVIAGGQVGIAGHLTIGTCTQIAAQSGVTKNILPASKIGGTPSVPIQQYHRQAVALAKLVKK